MPDSLFRFFNIPAYNIKDVTITKPDGTTIEKTEREANDLPFYIDWCQLVGISIDTMYEWIKVHPEFSASYKKTIELREKLVVVNALQGLYTNAFAIFTMKNKFGWRDEQHLKTEHNETKEININLNGLTADELRTIIQASRTKTLSVRTDGVSEVGSSLDKNQVG